MFRISCIANNNAGGTVIYLLPIGENQTVRQQKVHTEYLTADNMSPEDLAMYGGILKDGTVVLRTGTDRGRPVGEAPDAYKDEIWTVDPGSDDSHKITLRQQIRQIKRGSVAGSRKDSQDLFGEALPSNTSPRRPQAQPVKTADVKPPVAVTFETQAGEVLNVTYSDVLISGDIMILIVSGANAPNTTYMPVNPKFDSVCQIAWPAGPMLYSVVPTGIVFKHQQYTYCMLKVREAVPVPDDDMDDAFDEDDE